MVRRNLLLVTKHRVWSVHQPSTVVLWLDINLLLIGKSLHQSWTLVPWLDINLLLIGWPRVLSLHQSWTLVLWLDINLLLIARQTFNLFNRVERLCPFNSDKVWMFCWLEDTECRLFISLEHLYCDWTSIYYWLDDTGCCLFISLEHLYCDRTSICCWMQDKHLISSSGLHDYVPSTARKCECSVDSQI